MKFIFNGTEYNHIKNIWFSYTDEPYEDTIVMHLTNTDDEQTEVFINDMQLGLNELDIVKEE